MARRVDGSRGPLGPHRRPVGWRELAEAGLAYAGAVEALGEALAAAVRARRVSPIALGSKARRLVGDAPARWALNRLGAHVRLAVSLGRLDVLEWPQDLQLAVARAQEAYEAL